MDDPFGDDDDLFRDDFFAQIDTLVAQHVKKPAQDQQGSSQVLPHQNAPPVAPLAGASNQQSSHVLADQRQQQPAGPQVPASSRQWQQPNKTKGSFGGKPIRAQQLQLHSPQPPQHAGPVGLAQKATPAWQSTGPNQGAHMPYSTSEVPSGGSHQQRGDPGDKQVQPGGQAHQTAPSVTTASAHYGGMAWAGPEALQGWQHSSKPAWGASAAGVLEPPPVERNHRRSLRELFSKGHGGQQPAIENIRSQITGAQGNSGPGPLSGPLGSSSGAGSDPGAGLAAMDVDAALPKPGYGSNGLGSGLGSGSGYSSGPGSGVPGFGLVVGQGGPSGVATDSQLVGGLPPAASSALLQAQLDGHAAGTFSSTSGSMEQPGRLNATAQVEHAQHELNHLRERLASQEGTISIVRSKLEAAEREKADLQQRLDQAASHTASTPAAFGMSPADLQRQIHTLQEQLTFKEQEVMEERRKHMERSERLREAEALAQQLRADASKTGIEQELLGTQKDRMSLHLSPRPSSASRLGVGKIASKQKPSPPQKRQLESNAGPHQAGLQGDEQAPAALRTSDGTNAGKTFPAAAQQNPLPPWELPLPQIDPQTEGKAWQRLWEAAGEHLGILLTAPGTRANDAATLVKDASQRSMGPQPRASASQSRASIAGHASKGATSAQPGTAKEAWHATLQEHLHRLAWEDAAAPQLLASLAHYAACWLTADPEGSRAEVLRRSASRALIMPPGRDEREAAAARQKAEQANAQSLQASLRVMHGLLDSSEAARQLAVASCHLVKHPQENTSTGEANRMEGMEQAHAVERARTSEGDGPLDARLATLLPRLSGRVVITSKGRVLRARGRLKDRPPDQAALELLRSLPVFGAGGGAHGLLRLLLQLLHQEAGEEADVTPIVLSTVQAVLAAVAGLVAAAPANCDRSAMLPLVTAGVLDSLAQRQQPELHPELLAILQLLLQDHELCAAWEARLQSHGTQQMIIGSEEAATSALIDHRLDQNGCTLLDIPVMCLATPLNSSDRTGGREGDTSGDRYAVQRQALAVLAQLLECGRMAVLRHLLGELPGLGLAPLSQQLLACVQDACGGGLLREEVSVRDERSTPLEWQQRLRLVQEAMLLLRGMLGEASLAVAVLDDLTSTSTTQSACLAILLRLVNWQPLLHDPRRRPPAPKFSLGPYTALAPWAMALGQRYCGREFYSTAGASPPSASLGEVVYLAKSVKRRVLHRLEHS